MKTFLATVILVLALVGVVIVRTISTDNNPTNTQHPNPTGATEKHYLQVQAGVTEVNDPETWSEYRFSPACFGPDCPPPLTVNFTTQTLLIASPGEEGSPGYVFKVDNATSYADKIVVFATLTTPGPYCFYAAVIDFPVQVVEVPKTTLPATLVMTTTQAPACPL